MTKNEFQKKLRRARIMAEIDPEFWHGYQRGLRRLFYGDHFGTLEEHATWSDPELLTSSDKTRRQRGQGYAAGLSGADPSSFIK